MLHKNYWDQGRAVKFHQPENQVRENLGLKYHVLGLKLVAIDQSDQS